MEQPFIVEGTRATFQKEVVESKRPVILDFYADWCQPCKRLTPVLEATVMQARGAIKLVKINADKEEQLCQAFQIQSLPTVMALANGKVIDSFVGVPQRPQLQAFFQLLMDEANKALGPVGVAEKHYEEMQAAAAAGNLDDANRYVQYILDTLKDDDSEPAQTLKAKTIATLLKNVVASRKDLEGVPALVNTLRTTYARFMDLTEVEQALASAALLPKEGAGPSSADLNGLQLAVQQNPKDLAARFALASALIDGGSAEQAIEHLLAIVQGDKNWREGAAKEQLVKVFDALGGSHPAVIAGRKRFAKLLFM